MKRIKTSLLACALILVSHAAHAQLNCCCDLGDFNLSASALLWRVGGCEARYAMSGTADMDLTNFGFNTADYQYIDTGWDWGVRVAAGLDRGCYWGEVDYLWYEATGSSTTKLSGPPSNDPANFNYVTINGAPGSWGQVHSNARVRYQHATVTLGLPFCRQSCCRLDGVALARFLDLGMRTHIRAANPTMVIPAVPPVVPAAFTAPFPDSRGSGGSDAGFQGGGLGVGLKGACEVKCGLKAKGRFNVFAFFGKSQTAGSAFTVDPEMVLQIPGVILPIPGQDLRFSVPGRSCWVPGMEFGLGLVYGFECGCTAITLELGWDSYYYYNALHETTSEPANAATFTTGTPSGRATQNGQLKNSEFNTIAFGGPTFSLRAEF